MRCDDPDGSSVLRLVLVLMLGLLCCAAAFAGAPGAIRGGVYYCAADWNNDGSPGESADVVACIQSALSALTTNEDGSDNAITLSLPDGYFDVSSACSAGSCFELKSGIHIVGEMPRLRYVEHEAPDLKMEPNGGTWLDPGPSNTLFTGQHLRGVVLERFGVANFGKVAVLGRDGVDGISFSVIRDVYAVGTSRWASPRTTDAWVFYNIQHLQLDHVKVHGAERGLYIIGQNSHWQPANSVITDFYVYTYPNPQGGIRLETIDSAEGPSTMMNYVSFIRPQVNSFSSTGAPGSTGIWLKGYDPARPVQLMWIDGADVEGSVEVAIRLENANHNRIEVAGVTKPTIGVSLDANSSFNTIASVHDRLSVRAASDANNIFLGHFDDVDEATARGLYYDRLQNRWSVALGRKGVLNSGSGYLFFDDTGKRWLVKDGDPSTPSDGSPIVTGTGAAASRGPVSWTDEPTSCSAACLATGMVNCVDAWDGGTSVGCNATNGRRLCACR